jgi:hypothetical protein
VKTKPLQAFFTQCIFIENKTNSKAVLPLHRVFLFHRNKTFFTQGLVIDKRGSGK